MVSVQRDRPTGKMAAQPLRLLWLRYACFSWPRRICGSLVSGFRRPVCQSAARFPDPGRRTSGHRRDFRGHYVLIYFGYTACADVCPTTLTAIADAIDILGSRASNLRPVFISIDAKRNSPAVVRAYAEKFSPNILGLSWNVGYRFSAIERALAKSAARKCRPKTVMRWTT